MYRIYIFLFAVICFVSCQPNQEQRTPVKNHALVIEENEEIHHHHHHEGVNEHMNKRSFEELVTNFESADRAVWQKPEKIIALFGDIENKTIIDIGCGTGYFSFPLVKNGAKVICADVDDRFLNYVKNKRDVAGISDSLMEIRKVPYDSPNLEDKEADFALIVDTYHHIEKREAYFQLLKKGLSGEGLVVIVDFKKEESDMGPPVEMRIDRDDVVKELKAAGFTKFRTNDSLLPYQYIVMAE